jgi:hypothetical protein
MLPAIIAAHQRILGTSDFVKVGEWLRRSWFALFVAYAVAVYVMLRRFLPLGYAVPAVLICIFSIHTVFMSDLAFPEIPFGLTTVLFVLCNGSERLPGRRFLTAALAVTAFALRTVGVALLAAWVFESLCRRQFRQMGMRLLLAMALVLCWSGYIAYVESGREYQTPAYEYQRAAYNYINVSYARNIRYKDTFSPELGDSSLADRLGQFVENVAQMPVSMGESVSLREPTLASFREGNRLGLYRIVLWVAHASLLCLAALIVAGATLQLRRWQSFIPVYILFFLAMVCATPWPSQFNRYLTPLAPFLSLSLFLALRAAANVCSQWFPGRSKTISGALAVLAISILGCQGVVLFRTYTRMHPRVTFDIGRDAPVEYRLFFYQDMDRATDAGLDWLRMHAENGGVVVATDPQWAYLRTGLKAVLPPFETDSGKAQRLLDTAGVRYLIVDESVYKKYTAKVVADHPAQWQRVFSDSIREQNYRPVQGTLDIYERITAR